MRQYIDNGSVSLVILELGLALLFRAIVISSTMVGRSVTKHSTRTCVVCVVWGSMLALLPLVCGSHSALKPKMIDSSILDTIEGI